MNFYKKLSILLAFCGTFFCTCVMGQTVSFEETESFFPNWKQAQEHDITWAYLTVPENWAKPDTSRVKIAVSILKNKSNIKDAEAVVFIQGGPGARSVWGVNIWFNHPLQKDKDIVVLDLRGTGLTEPRLCPDLGGDIFKILAKNQTEAEDEKEKTAAALNCKRELLDRGIAIETYNSWSVAKDLNALKTQLGYDQWHVYGVSYGTYMAQVYASTFPDDVKTLLLDSSVDAISDYYRLNTSNYMTSLAKVFEVCKNDVECDRQYPNLEEIYFKTINDLAANPITVSVGKELVKSEEFTYNAEDFKVAIQQGLYHKQLVEVIPLLIYQFHERNESALGNLVAAFSNLLMMDYGVYYCVTCNEVLPNNDLSAYNADAKQYQGLDGGIAFYESDFKVCEQWNRGRADSLMMHHDLSNLSSATFPVAVIAGEYDPITPVTNGEKVISRFANAQFVEGLTYGHVPGFTEIGGELAGAFISNPKQKLDAKSFDKANPLNPVKDITINAGVSKMGNSLNRLDVYFMAPLLIATLLMVSFLFVYLIKFFRRKYTHLPDKVIRLLTILTSLVGVVCFAGFAMALGNVAGSNFYVLAFGLPSAYNYLFICLIVFVVLMVVTLLYFMLRIKKINDRSIVFSVIFSHIILTIYFIYWGVL